MTYEEARKVMPLVPEANDVLKKLLKWKWRQELFDLYYYPWNTKKIYSIDKKAKEDFFPRVNGIPILGWERIEKILGKAGYWFHIETLMNLPGIGYQVKIHKPSHKSLVKIVAKSRQQAVLLAILALRKEIERLAKRRKNKKQKKSNQNPAKK